MDKVVKNVSLYYIPDDELSKYRSSNFIWYLRAKPKCGLAGKNGIIHEADREHAVSSIRINILTGLVI